MRVHPLVEGATLDPLFQGKSREFIVRSAEDFYIWPSTTTTPLATLIKFQLHDHICGKILKQDVRACDYSGSAEVGKFLRGILALGATRDWRAVIQDATGEPIGPRALMAFYQPLVAELGRRNQGKDCAR